jgi:hypothetical protein
VTQDLPPARAIHDRDVDPLDIHCRQGRRRVEAARPCDGEMRMTRSASAPQLAPRLQQRLAICHVPGSQAAAWGPKQQ